VDCLTADNEVGYSTKDFDAVLAYFVPAVIDEEWYKEREMGDGLLLSAIGIMSLYHPRRC